MVQHSETCTLTDCYKKKNTTRELVDADIQPQLYKVPSDITILNANNPE